MVGEAFAETRESEAVAQLAQCLLLIQCRDSSRPAGCSWATSGREQSGVAEVGKAFLHDRALKWLRSRSDVPILVSTSSDGTPVTTKERWTFSGRSLQINRSGGSPRELFVQRVFMRDATGHSSVFVAEPVPLTAEK